MTKGTSSRGKKSGKRTTARCRRCGRFWKINNIKKICLAEEKRKI